MRDFFGYFILNKEKTKKVDLFSFLNNNTNYYNMENLHLFLINENNLCVFNKVVVLFTGNLYNKNDLLKNNDYFFENKSKNISDEYFIYLMYKKYDINFLKQIDGLFSILIFDTMRNNLFIARDKIGIKNIFYTIYDDKLLFATKIKFFYNNKLFNLKIDEKSLNYYFDLRFIPSPNTIFKNVFKLDAGQYLQMDNFNKKLQYFNKYVIKNGIIDDNNFSDISNIYFDLLNDSVRTSINQNGDYVTFLSGGLDSASISALINKNLINRYNKKSKNISISYETSYNNIDESDEARKIANFIGNDFINCKLKNSEILSIFNESISYLDEPIYSSISPSTLFLAKNAKALNIINVMTGEGSDELLFGYNYLNDAVNNNYLLCYFEKLFWITKDIKKKLMINYKNFLNDSYDEYFDKKNQLDSIRYFKFKQLADYDLNRVKTMVYSQDLDLYLPFTRNSIIEFLTQFNTNSMLTMNNGKAILKNAIKDLIPQEIINKRKIPFRSPIKIWIDNELKDAIYKTLLNEKICEEFGFDIFCMKGIIVDHYNKKNDNSVLIWGLLVLFKWLENFIKNN